MFILTRKKLILVLKIFGLISQASNLLRWVCNFIWKILTLTWKWCIKVTCAVTPILSQRVIVTFSGNCFTKATSSLVHDHISPRKAELEGCLSHYSSNVGIHYFHHLLSSPLSCVPLTSHGLLPFPPPSVSGVMTDAADSGSFSCQLAARWMFVSAADERTELQPLVTGTGRDDDYQTNKCPSSLVAGLPQDPTAASAPDSPRRVLLLNGSWTSRAY